MLAEDLVLRPGEHPEQTEAAREHLEMWGYWPMGAQREDVTGKEKLMAMGVPEDQIIETRQGEIPRIGEESSIAVRKRAEENFDWESIRKKATDAVFAPNPLYASLSEDQINRPSHYTKGIETIEYIESWGMDFRAANVIKYVTRYPHKGKPLSDLKKARWYIDRLIKELENGHE